MRIQIMSIAYLLAFVALAQTDPVGVHDAAIRLKKAHVDRTLEVCRLRGAVNDDCLQLLGILHKRELNVLARLQSAHSDPKLNVDQFNAEFTSCYSPNSDYSNLIDCWEALADRLDAARKGRFLLKH